MFCLRKSISLLFISRPSSFHRTFCQAFDKQAHGKQEQDHQGDSVPQMREPHREGWAEYTGRITRRYGEQETGDLGRDDIYDYFLARQVGTQVKFKFTARGPLITGTTYNLLTIELKNPSIQVTGPITEGPSPRVETIEFRADATDSDVAVLVTTINEDDATAWTTDPLA